LPGPDFCFIFAPCGYDEPEILPPQNPSVCLTGPDGEHFRRSNEWEFFVVYFAKSKMTLRAPTRKAATVGMRRLSDPATIQYVRRTLSRAPHKARGNWSRLAQEYESKINSGDIVAIAEVMRDLYRPAVNSGQSYSDRQLYTSALDRLSGEVALVNGITEEEAVKELESLVMAGARCNA
jgi:CarD family transcriptional regulator